MKNKIFLPVEPDGSLIIPAMIIEHLGVNISELLAVNLPAEPSCCMDCEELELHLSTCCDEPQCGGYTTHSEEVNLPQGLLDIADIPAGADLTAVCFEHGVLFLDSDVFLDPETLNLGEQNFVVLPLEKLCASDE